MYCKINKTRFINPLKLLENAFLHILLNLFADTLFANYFSIKHGKQKYLTIYADSSTSTIHEYNES